MVGVGVIVGVEVAGGTVHVGTGVGTVIRIVLSMPFQPVTAAPTPKMLSVDAPVSGSIESSLSKNICSQYEIGVAVATGGIHVGAGVGGTSVGMGVEVGQCVGVGGMGVFVGVMVGVSVGVAVGVLVGVFVGIGVGSIPPDARLFHIIPSHQRRPYDGSPYIMNCAGSSGSASGVKITGT